jgi:peptidoglycan lytic transglycosylase D
MDADVVGTELAPMTCGRWWRGMPKTIRLMVAGALLGVTYACAARAGDPSSGSPRGDDGGHANVPVTDSAAERSPFPAPAGLKPQVEFWKRTFTTYSTRQVVIHDALHLNRVYEVLDFRPLVDSGVNDADADAYEKEKVRSEKERIRALLLRLHQAGPNPEGLTEEERTIWASFEHVKEPSKFLAAAADDRIRAQRGLRERFATGVEVSRRYLPEMELVFRREGLPVELTRLPLVESCFNIRAYSKKGAAGIWQFMPATGRLYMHVGDAVDERRDPLASTAGAAEYLKASYELLGSWPLAVTAYNHGRAGVAHAVSTVGSADLVQIIKRYHGPAFKFASRNFYAEFLAALEVERHYQDYFGDLRVHEPLRVETVVVPDYVTMKALARAANTDVDTLADLNPALTPPVVSGKLRVPKAYRLHVPPGSAAKFTALYASLPNGEKSSGQRAYYVTHRVQPGQTLAAIAKRYRTTIAAIQRRNNLRSTTRLRTGQSLVIPTG